MTHIFIRAQEKNCIVCFILGCLHYNTSKKKCSIKKVHFFAFFVFVFLFVFHPPPPLGVHHLIPVVLSSVQANFTLLIFFFPSELVEHILGSVTIIVE